MQFLTLVNHLHLFGITSTYIFCIVLYIYLWTFFSPKCVYPHKNIQYSYYPVMMPHPKMTHIIMSLFALMHFYVLDSATLLPSKYYLFSFDIYHLHNIYMFQGKHTKHEFISFNFCCCYLCTTWGGLAESVICLVYRFMTSTHMTKMLVIVLSSWAR